MIETLITDLIKALDANTEALRAYTATAQSPSIPDAPQKTEAPVTEPAKPAEPAPQAQAPQEPAKPAEPAPQAQAQAPAPQAPAKPAEPAPAPAPQAQAPAEPAPELTKADVRKKCVAASTKGHLADIKSYFATAGVKTLDELPPEKYADFVAYLSEKAGV